MNFRYLGILCMMSFFLASCVRDDIINPIPFDKIVGDYRGFSKSCEAKDVSSDTLCSSGISNIFKITIYNQSTISVSDKIGSLDTLKLKYTKSETNNNGETHFFKSGSLTSFYSLHFTEQLGSIIFEHKVSIDNQVKTDFFSGNK